MADIITTLHPENDDNINLYPNIKSENIPNGSVTEETIKNGSVTKYKLSEDIKNTIESIDEIIKTTTSNIKNIQSQIDWKLGAIIAPTGQIDISNKNAVSILNITLEAGDVIGFLDYSTYVFAIFNGSNFISNGGTSYWNTDYTVQTTGNYGFMLRKIVSSDMTNFISDAYSKFGKKVNEVNIELMDKVVTKSSLDNYLFELNIPLHGKRIVFLGTSLTHGNNSGTSITWCNKLGEKYDMDYYNYGLNGNPIADTVNNTTGNAAMCLRYTEMVENADYIVVEGGANDRAYSVPIGVNDSLDITTFKGALNVLISGLQAKYPKGKILFMTTWERIGNTKVNGVGAYEHEYADAMLDVCKKHRIPCINNYYESGISWLNENQIPWMDEGVVSGGDVNYHFSAEAYSWMLPRYEDAIKRL